MANVSVKIGGNWLPLKRSSNNQWPYYNTNGPWQGSFPMPIRITSATGEVVEDNIPNAKGGEGSKQFTEVCLSLSTVTPSSLCMLKEFTPALKDSMNDDILSALHGRELMRCSMLCACELLATCKPLSAGLHDRRYSI